MCKELRLRFAKHIKHHWTQNNHLLKDISFVYALLSINTSTKEIDIEYIGSTTMLFSRYKSHKIPCKIQEDDDKISLMYFIPMSTGFYDYEIKLIKKLQPFFNKQHKKIKQKGGIYGIA